MVSTTLTTIVASSAETNSHHHHQHTQGYAQHSQSHSVRNFYLNDSKPSSVSGNKLQNSINNSERPYTNSNLSAGSATPTASISHQQVATPTTSPLSRNSCSKNDTGSVHLSASPPISDKISLLFPKCRPKNDVNLNIVPKSNKINNSSNNQPADSSPVSSSLSSESLSSVTPRISTNPFLNPSSIPDTPQERPIASASQNYSSNLAGTKNFQSMPRKRSYHGPNQNPFIKDTYWETRHNTTPASTVLNSPDLTENESRNHFIQKQHVKVGRSPVSHPELLPPIGLDTPTRGVAVVADGEVVVFDDIAESWQNLRVTTDHTSTEHNPQAQQQQQLCSNDTKDILLEQTNYEQRDGGMERKFIDRNFAIPAGIRHGIIEYEGSPRRIGQGSPEGGHQSIQLHLQRSKVYTASAPLHAARPGFPQRIFSQPPETPSPIGNDAQQSNTEDTSNDVSEIGTSSDFTSSEKPKSSTFDYLYEFSETRKVLEEFFKCPSNEEKPVENGSDVDSTDIHYDYGVNLEADVNNYIEQRIASSPISNHQQEDEIDCKNESENGLDTTNNKENHDIDFFLESASRSSADILEQHDGINQNRVPQRTFRYSPETTDYDSNCGDLDSLSGEYNGVSPYTNYAKYYASMPVLEDGLSSGHASDTENNNQPSTGISILMDMKRTSENQENREISNSSDFFFKTSESPNSKVKEETIREPTRLRSPGNHNKVFKNIDPDLDSLYSISVFHRSDMIQLTPPPPAPAPHRKTNSLICSEQQNSEANTAALKDLHSSLSQTQPIRPTMTKILTTPLIPTVDKQRNTTAPSPPPPPPPPPEKIASSPILCSPVWIPRQLDNSKNSNYGDSVDHHNKNLSADEEDVDTDLETDRLLGHQRLDDQGFYDEGKSWERKPRSLLASSLSKFSPKVQPTNKNSSTNLLRQGLNSLLPTTPELAPPPIPNKTSTKLLDIGDSTPSPEHIEKSPENNSETKNCMTDSPDGSSKSKKDSEKKGKKSKNKEVLIEGVLFRARYLGSTQLVCEGQPTKSTRMMQAEEAVSRIKAPDGEGQPSTEVDLFISTEKIMVLNTDLKEIMMDHALRTISYIADIGDLVVLMARRRFVPQDIDDAPKPNRTPKMICHVFESDEAQFIAQSIGQAFQVAYMEFLKANGIEDHSFVKEMDYQEVLNSQEIFGDELEIFAKKELQKEVVVPKAKGEILGVVIVESGWGSMLPTVVIANLMSTGAAARCGQLNIGDQLIAINGLSLVGLPLSTCQNYIKNSKNQTVVKFTVVPCAPVVEVKIKRPNTKYQLGFSVQNGVICSLLRGGIAERGGVRVGHRIIEINNQSVVAVPHEKIVNLLATSVGEILMKTMPTSMFRLLTGQENPIYI
ncbi:uncharacterized protein LOC119657601 isoform X2 [Hermetia illucens]|uniref:uncharacterized protein LOC119657601 isoform X2 n=1 Tax=Hermetia illucens TaxID=343691 RepID=UPI0018CBF866|nr:uncharacterized protein LOC119657601 isoform X2 [Hermetia illucens]